MAGLRGGERLFLSTESRAKPSESRAAGSDDERLVVRVLAGGVTSNLTVRVLTGGVTSNDDDEDDDRESGEEESDDMTLMK